MRNFNHLFPGVLLAYATDKNYTLSNYECNELSKYVSGLELDRAALEQARAELESLRTELIDRTTAACVWSADTGFDYTAWDTSCGQSYIFEDGDPTENDMRFCPFCGKLLVVLARDEPAEDAQP